MRALLALPLLAACATTTSAAPAADEGPVVIELFSSQGCDSCPPAEELLNRLARAGQSQGRAVAPLSFHVDYWNDGGWVDPYASPAWTQRQTDYARRLDGRIYTPELVVAGEAGMNGAHEAEVERAIAKVPKVGKLAATAAWSDKQLTVTATAPADTEVWVAVWEDGTKTNVPRGENAGKLLADDRVVRELKRVASASKQGTITIALDGGWHAGGAVAFAQSRDRRVVSARLLPR